MNQLDKAIFDIAHEQISGKQVGCAAARVKQNGCSANAAASVRTRPATATSACAPAPTSRHSFPAYLNRTLSAGRVPCSFKTTPSRVPGMPACSPERPRGRCADAGAAGNSADAHHLPRLGNRGSGNYCSRSDWMAGRPVVPLRARAVPVAVQTVSGILYAVSDRGSTPIFAGHPVAAGPARPHSQGFHRRYPPRRWFAGGNERPRGAFGRFRKRAARSVHLDRRAASLSRRPGSVKVPSTS